MHRKLLPLALMYAEEGETVEGRTRLQKMVFLLEKALEQHHRSPIDGPQYNFIPYDYGPFSKTLYDDLDYLCDEGLVEDSEEKLDNGQVKYEYEITDEGRDFVKSQLLSADGEVIVELADDIRQEFNHVLLSNLIDYVYSEYPEYAENSVW